MTDGFRASPLSRTRRPALIVGVAASIVLVIGGVFDAPHFFRAYLIGWLLWLGAALGAMAMLMIHHLTGGRWGWPIRRLAEAAASTLPFVAVGFLPLLLGLRHVFPWADVDAVAREPVLQHRRVLFSVPLTLGRAAIFLALWSLLAWRLRAASLRQDETCDSRAGDQLKALSAAGLVLLFITVSLASVDWLVSREVDWYSSTFGLITVLGQAVTGLSVLLIALALVSETRGMRPVITDRATHDLGNLFQTTVVLWAYVSFMQYLVIWIGNGQDETIWFFHRTSGLWNWVGRALIAFGFAVPFVLLLFQNAKRDIRVLARIAAGVLAMRFVDMLWTIDPSNAGPEPGGVYWLDFVAPIALGGLGWTCFVWQVGQAPLVPAAALTLKERADHVDVTAT